MYLPFKSNNYDYDDKVLIKIEPKYNYWSKSIDEIFNIEKFSDTVLEFNSRQFYVIKNIIQDKSVFIYDILNNYPNKDNSIKINEPLVNIDSFETFLYYFYTGYIKITTKNLYDLLYLSNKYGIGEIRDACYTS